MCLIRHLINIFKFYSIEFKVIRIESIFQIYIYFLLIFYDFDEEVIFEEL